MTDQNQNRGFTLVETLVAISILVVVIVGPMTLAAKGLQNAYHAREQLTATYLAQEGFELVRLRRDTFTLNTGGPDWLHNGGINGRCEVPAYEGCNMDARTDIGLEQACVDPGPGEVIDHANCGLSYSSAALPSGAPAGMYIIPGDADAPFRRLIEIRDIDSTPSKEVEVTVTVQWKSSAFGGSVKEVVLRGRLFDQYDNIP